MKRSNYFTPREVASHNHKGDIWVSLNQNVLDLTNLVSAVSSSPKFPHSFPLLRAAGQDVSHWFDCRVPYDSESIFLKRKTSIHGSYLFPILANDTKVFMHFPPEIPVTDFDTVFRQGNMEQKEQIEKPWWQQRVYVIGRLTKQVVNIKLVNELMIETNGGEECTEIMIEGCEEETINELQYRVHKGRLNYNIHDYFWKVVEPDGSHRLLDMSLTLQENQVSVGTNEGIKFGMPKELYTVVIHLEYKDTI
eukprot:snap_masked-scaffold_1-processed-gene-28.25-mRNA-1 protein AED:0.38 eAED:0.49 QI:0/-1/0/1/-1/1/1/0/249